MSSIGMRDGPSHGSVRATTITISLMVLAVFLPYSLGILAPAIIRDLDIADAEFGLITGAVYLVAGLSAGWFGRVSDRLDLRTALIAAFAICAIGFASFSLVNALVPAILLAALGGCVLAVSNPISNLLVVRAFPAHRWGTLIGWKQSGVPIAAIISGLAIAPLAEAVGWRTTLLFMTLVPLGVLLLCLKRVENYAAPIASETKSPKAPPLPVNFGFLITFSLLMGVGNGIITSYYVLYARTQIDASPLDAAAIVVVLGVVGTVVRVFGARVLVVMRLEAALACLASIGTLSSLCVIAAAHAGIWLMYLGAVLAGAGALGWLTFAMMALATQTPSGGLGRASGYLSQTFYIGLLLGPPLAGSMLAISGGYMAMWLTQGAFYAIAVAASLVTWARTRSTP